jgi:pentatricopeptide repeat protein
MNGVVCSVARVQCNAVRVLAANTKHVAQFSYGIRSTATQPPQRTRSAPWVGRNSPESEVKRKADFIERNVQRIRAGEMSHLDPRQIAHLIRNASDVALRGAPEQRNLDTVFEILAAALKAFRADQYVIEATINACFAHKQPERIANVLELLSQYELGISELMVNAIITGYCKLDMPELAFESYLVAQENGMAVTHKENTLLESLISHRKLDQAHAILKRMVETSDRYKYPNDYTWLSVASACAGQDPYLAIKLFEQYGRDFSKLPSAFWEKLIYLMFQVRKMPMKDVWNIWKLCKQHCAKLDSSLYSTFIVGMNKLQVHESVIELMEEMRKSNIEPEEPVYLAAIGACVKTNRLDQAQEILFSMRNSHYKPNQTAYMLVLEAYVKAGDFAKALGLLEHMKIDNVKPTATMWSVIIHGLGRATQFERACSILEQAKQALDHVSYGTVLKSLFQTRLGEYSLQQLQELRASGMNVADVNLRNAIVTAMGDGGVQSSFQSVLDEMDAAGIQPDEVMFNILLTNCVPHKKLDQARALIKRMEQQYHITPSSVTWGIFLRVLGSCKKVDEAVAIFDEKVPPQKRTMYDYNVMIHAMMRNNRMDLALKYFDELNTTNLGVSEITANILMNGYSRTKSLDRCFETFASFKDRLQNMSAVSYNTLISCCISHKKPDRAVQVLADMHAAGVQPLNTAGWDVAEGGINMFNKMEQGMDLVKKTSGITACSDLLRLCAECNRRDLVLAAAAYMRSAHVPWSAIREQLLKDDPEVVSKVELWLQKDGELPPTEEQLQKVDASPVPAL